MSLVPMDPRDAMVRAQWEDHRDFMVAEDATSIMCDSCGEVIEIPMELRGGPQVEEYYCDACEESDNGNANY